MKKKSLFNIKPTDIIVLGSVLIVIGLTYFVFLPQVRLLGANGQQVTDYTNQANALQTAYDSLGKVADLLPQHKQQLDTLSVAYPSEENVAEAMIQLQAMADKTGLAITSMSPSAVKQGVLPISISLKGNYQSYTNFLHELSVNVRPITVQNVTLATQSDKDRTTLIGNFTLNFAYNLQAASAPTTSATAPTTSASR